MQGPSFGAALCFVPVAVSGLVPHRPGTIRERRMDETEGEWLSPSEAARRTGYSRRWINKLADQGEIRSRPIDNQRREVLIPSGMRRDQDRDHPGTDPETVALLVENARLEERLTAAEHLAASQRREAGLEAQVTLLRAELAEARKGWLERLLEVVRRQ
jgi:hypothetical protein